jgi:prophage regulatory protein
MTQELRIVAMKEVEILTSLKRSTIYKKLKTDSAFPKPVSLIDSSAGSARTGFVLSEILDWIEGRIAKRNEN